MTPLYRVKYWDAPIPHGTGAFLDYDGRDLPLREAEELAASVKLRYPKSHAQVQPAPGPASRRDLIHAVSTVAKGAGIAIPNPAKMTKPELNMAGAFIARATNHGNRAPKPNMVAGTDKQGRLVLKLGGAR